MRYEYARVYADRAVRYYTGGQRRRWVGNPNRNLARRNKVARLRRLCTRKTTPHYGYMESKVRKQNALQLDMYMQLDMFVRNDWTRMHMKTTTRRCGRASFLSTSDTQTIALLRFINSK